MSTKVEGGLVKFHGVVLIVDLSNLLSADGKVTIQLHLPAIARTRGGVSSTDR